MAENESKPVDNVDALAAMASGADLDANDPQAAPVTDIPVDPNARPPEEFAPQVEEQTDGPPPIDPLALGISAPAGAPTTRAAAARKLQSQTSASLANQYKAMLVPLLLGIGSILLVIAAICWFGASPDANGHTPLNLHPSFRFFALICGPLGLILLVGSYWFHLELSRKKK